MCWGMLRGFDLTFKGYKGFRVGTCDGRRKGLGLFLPHRPGHQLDCSIPKATSFAGIAWYCFRVGWEMRWGLEGLVCVIGSHGKHRQPDQHHFICPIFAAQLELIDKTPKCHCQLEVLLTITTLLSHPSASLKCLGLKGQSWWLHHWTIQYQVP